MMSGKKHMSRMVNGDQSGIVSIMVAMTMMVIITMIVLTYSQIIRREQRQTLDRQLSSQAFYAAESAVNAINAAIGAGVITADSIKTTAGGCTEALTKMQAIPAAAAYYNSIPKNTPGSTQAVTCVTVDPSSRSLSYSSIPVDSSQIAHLQTAVGTMNSVEIAWQEENSSAFSLSGAAGTPLTSFAGWGSTIPLLRIDMVPASAIVNSDTLYNAAQDFFLYPKSCGGPPAVCNTIAVTTPTEALKGAIISGACINGNLPKSCRVTITGFVSPDLYLRIRPVYRAADVVITPKNGGASVALTGGQVVVDATGRAQDVLKRISVRRPATPNYTTPNFVIDSTSGVCKKLFAAPGDTTDAACGIN